MTEKHRNKKIRDRVVDMYKEIVSEVDPKNVFDLLIQKRVISIEQKQEMMNKVTVIIRCRALLDHLLSCSNDEAFIVLREALEEHYHWIVKRLDQCETENETEETLDATGNQRKMTKTEQQEHPEHPVHVNLEFCVEERLKKVLESMKSIFEIGSKKIVQCEEIRKDIAKIIEQLEESKKEADEMKEQQREESRKIIAKMKKQYEESRQEAAYMKEQYEESRKKIAKMKKQYEESRKDSDEMSEQGEESRKDIATMKKLYEESRKQYEESRTDNAKMEEQYRILKESLDKSLLRERNLKKELDEIKSWAKPEIGHKRIFGNAKEAQQNPLPSSSESTKECNEFAVVIANSEATIRMSLNRPEDPLPAKIYIGTAAAVYNNSIFVCGLGKRCEEIWRLDATSSNWSKCASLIQGREYHSVAFVNHVLYICGGWLESSRKELDDVETYNTYGDRCSKVGKLAYAVYSSGNCVPYKASLYIFGGYDTKGNAVSSVQVYDTKLNTCTLLTNPMPRACTWLRGELWKNYFILHGNAGCFIYDIETQTWEVRDKFKFEHMHFGVIVDDGKLFVFGCGAKKDEVRWIPIANILNDELIEWRHYAKLPNNFCEKAFAFGKSV